MTDSQYGVVRVRAWAGLHPKLQDWSGHGTKGPSPIVPMTLVLVEVSRLPGRSYPPQVLWLWLHAPAGYAPDLDLLWRAYVRRSGAPWALEHTFHFLKQTLGWHTLRVRYPEQADAGRGSCWPPTPNCASPAPWSPTAACPRNGGTRRDG